MLKVLTLQAFGGTSSGCVQLNEKALTFDRFKKDFAVVEQHDTHWTYLSVMEHLECAANMYLLKDTTEERKKKIQELLETLGLEGASGTRANKLSGMDLYYSYNTILPCQLVSMQLKSFIFS